MKDIAFSLFITNERFLMLQLVINHLEKKLESKPELQPVYDKLTAIGDKLKQAIQKNMGSEFTAVLSHLDEHQDNGFVCFRNGVNAKRYSILNETLRPMADQLESVIRRHGWSMMNHGYQKKLTLSRSLISEMRTPANQAIIQQLNQQQEFEAWSKAVDDFEKTFTQKIESSAAKSDVAASEIAKEAIELIEKLLAGWHYQIEINEDESYQELVNQILEGAGDIEAQARARITRRRNQKEVDSN